MSAGGAKQENFGMSPNRTVAEFRNQLSSHFNNEVLCQILGRVVPSAFSKWYRRLD